MVEEDKSWPVRVVRQSDALDLEEGVFTWKGPRCIALALQRSAEASRYLHPLWPSFCRHGTAHQCGCRYAGQDRRGFTALAAREKIGRTNRPMMLPQTPASRKSLTMPLLTSAGWRNDVGRKLGVGGKSRANATRC